MSSKKSINFNSLISIIKYVLTTLGVFVLAGSVQADDSLAVQKLVPCGNGGSQSDCTFVDLFILINNVMHFLIFNIGLVVATIVIIAAGILYVFYPYKPGNISLAKNMLWAAIGGLVIMMSAYVIVKFVVLGLVGPSSNEISGSNEDLVSKIQQIFQDIPNTSQ